MAKVYVTEFTGIGAAHGDHYGIPAAREPRADGSADIGAGNAQTPVFEEGTTVVRVFAEADCFIAIGVSANAETGHKIPLAAGQFDYFTIAGNGQRVGVVQRTVS